MVIAVLAFLVLSVLVVDPLLLLLGAKVCRIPQATYGKTLKATLLTLAASLAAGGLDVLVDAWIGPGLIGAAVFALMPLVIAVWLLWWILKTSVWRACGAFGIRLVVSVGLAFALRATVVEAFAVGTDGMAPTLVTGDRVLAEKVSPLLGPPRRGDVVVFRAPPIPWKASDQVPYFRHVPTGPRPETTHVKRVAGMAGDVVQLREGRLIVNGAEVREPWLYRGGTRGSLPEVDLLRNFGPVTVPPDCLFLLGDNRDSSYDSRLGGCIAVEKVKGRAGLIYWSRNPPADSPRWNIHFAHETRSTAWYSAPNRLRLGRIGPVR